MLKDLIEKIEVKQIAIMGYFMAALHMFAIGDSLLGYACLGVGVMAIFFKKPMFKMTEAQYPQVLIFLMLCIIGMVIWQLAIQVYGFVALFVLYYILVVLKWLAIK